MKLRVTMTDQKISSKAMVVIERISEKELSRWVPDYPKYANVNSRSNIAPNMVLRERKSGNIFPKMGSKDLVQTPITSKERKNHVHVVGTRRLMHRGIKKPVTWGKSLGQNSDIRDIVIKVKRCASGNKDLGRADFCGNRNRFTFRNNSPLKVVSDSFLQSSSRNKSFSEKLTLRRKARFVPFSRDSRGVTSLDRSQTTEIAKEQFLMSLDLRRRVPSDSTALDSRTVNFQRAIKSYSVLSNEKKNRGASMKRIAITFAKTGSSLMSPYGRYVGQQVSKMAPLVSTISAGHEKYCNGSDSVFQGPSKFPQINASSKKLTRNKHAARNYNFNNVQRKRRHIEMVTGIPSKAWKAFNQCKDVSVTLKPLTKCEILKHIHGIKDSQVLLEPLEKVLLKYQRESILFN